MKSTKLWIIISGICGFTGVALGAFGAHGLRNILTPDMLEIYKTGVTYHLLHSIAILAIALSGKTKFLNSALFFLIGIILFSFSLYLYAVTGTMIFAMITPVGGISFLIGWMFLIIQAVKEPKDTL